jgi:hypothetical protein
MDKASKTQTAHSTGIKQVFSLRFIFIVLGLIVTIPISYTITHNFGIQIYKLIASQLISVLIIFFTDFRKSNRATLLRFLLRLSLAFITGFVVFPGEAFLTNAALSVYTLILLSFISYGLFDDYQKLGILSILAFVFNLIAALMLRVNAEFGGFGPLHSIFTAVSTIAVFAFFMLQNVDTSRRFGEDSMKIPASMNRAIITILSVVGLLMLIFTMMPWIQNVIEALIAGLAGLFARSLRFLLSLSRRTDYQSVPDDYSPGDFGLFPLIGDEDIVYEASEVNPVVMWLILGVFLLFLSTLIIFALIKLIPFIFKLLKTKHQRSITYNDVFTETIEKIESTRKKQSKKSRTKRLRYLDLQTERERIKYIYNEYVRRAKRHGLTRDAFNDTPNEILDEVTRSIQESREKRDQSFPQPGNLATAFNTVRYSDCNDSSIGITAQELRKKLT